MPLKCCFCLRAFSNVCICILLNRVCDVLISQAQYISFLNHVGRTWHLNSSKRSLHARSLRVLVFIGLCCLASNQSIARLALFNKVSEADFDTSPLLCRKCITLKRASTIPLNPPFHASTNDKGSKWISVGDYCYCHQSIAFGRMLCGVTQDCMASVYVCMCKCVHTSMLTPNKNSIIVRDLKALSLSDGVKKQRKEAHRISGQLYSDNGYQDRAGSSCEVRTIHTTNSIRDTPSRE